MGNEPLKRARDVSSTDDGLLFRREVLVARSSQQMGQIQLAQPVAITIAAIITAIICVAVIAFICIGEVTRKAKVSGLTVPAGGTVTVTALSSGVIIHSLVKEGEIARAGQPLFEISTEHQGTGGELSDLVAQQLSIRRDTINAERRMRLSQNTEKMNSLKSRQHNVDTELLQLEEEVELAKRRQSLAVLSLEKYEQLQKSGFVSQTQTQQKQEELIDLDSRRSSLERTKIQLMASRLNMDAEAKELGNDLATAITQLRRTEASLNQESVENQGRKANLIIAPKTGIVSAVMFSTGQAVSNGQSLATIVPQMVTGSKNENNIEVQLFAPSKTAGFVAPGQLTLLRYQAFPYQKFGLQRGTVIEISRTPFAPSELPPQLASTILSNAQQSSASGNGNEALYRIRVRLEKQSIDAYGISQTIPPHMTLDADIIQDHRKIWEWIAEPLLAAVKR